MEEQLLSFNHETVLVPDDENLFSMFFYTLEASLQRVHVDVL